MDHRVLFCAHHIRVISNSIFTRTKFEKKIPWLPLNWKTKTSRALSQFPLGFEREEFGVRNEFFHPKYFSQNLRFEVLVIGKICFTLVSVCLLNNNNNTKKHLKRFKVLHYSKAGYVFPVDVFKTTTEQQQQQQHEENKLNS